MPRSKPMGVVLTGTRSVAQPLRRARRARPCLRSSRVRLPNLPSPMALGSSFRAVGAPFWCVCEYARARAGGRAGGRACVCVCVCVCCAELRIGARGCVHLCWGPALTGCKHRPGTRMQFTTSALAATGLGRVHCAHWCPRSTRRSRESVKPSTHTPKHNYVGYYLEHPPTCALAPKA